MRREREEQNIRLEGGLWAANAKKNRHQTDVLSTAMCEIVIYVSRAKSSTFSLRCATVEGPYNDETKTSAFALSYTTFFERVFVFSFLFLVLARFFFLVLRVFFFSFFSSKRERRGEREDTKENLSLFSFFVLIFFLYFALHFFYWTKKRAEKYFFSVGWGVALYGSPKSHFFLSHLANKVTFGARAFRARFLVQEKMAKLKKN